ncbi:hypothetical protein D3C85_1576080 [compost metagenome]
MEQVVLAQGFFTAQLQAMGVYGERLLITVGEPGQHRHVLLLFRRQHVRCAVEEQVVLAQGFAMVRQVKHRGIDLVLIAAQ